MAALTPDDTWEHRKGAEAGEEWLGQWPGQMASL